MNIDIFLKGYCIALAVAAIPGPISIMSIRRTFAQGQAVGLAIGFGGAMGSVFYGFIAGFGLTLISNFLLAYQLIFRILGSLFLIYIGAETFLKRPSNNAASMKSNTLIGTAISTFLFDLSNPITILSLGAIFAGLGIGTELVYYVEVLSLVFGLFMGSFTWHIILTTVVSLFRVKMVNYLNIINSCSGCVLSAFGLINLIKLLS